MNEIIIDTKTEEKRYAVRENGLVTMFFVEQPKDRSEIGNIYLGIVESVKKGMNAAFVNIGKSKNGFLQLDQLPAFIHSTDPNKNNLPISSFIKKGEKLLVQVKKDVTGAKGPLLSAIIEITGERTVYMPEGKYIAVSKKADEDIRDKWREIAQDHQRSREGFIIRTEAFAGTEKEWIIEVDQLRNEFLAIEKKKNEVKAPALLSEKTRFNEELVREMTRLKKGEVICNDRSVLEKLKKYIQNDWVFTSYLDRENIFSKYRLDTELANAQKQRIWLKNGAYIVINETEAAVVIDVNTGKFTGKQAVSETVVKTNITAAKEIARQLQLRDYGGMILIDFIDMESRNDRKLVQQTLEKALKLDPKQTRAVGFTPLGIFEVTRKRTKQPLSATLQTSCQVCGGTGKVESPETAAFRLERELLELPFAEYEAVLIDIDQETKNAFSGENDRHLLKLETLFHIKIFFKLIDSAKYEYSIRQFGTIEEIQLKQ
ncbi:Rne/Rng family ribonuclease [Lederbergia citrea]|uniref:Rne/Rng family ribonuclease n=1 Tax=Lederbergia citrea TaxID=2833581 RepID=A0A942Z4N0_9BACI|nr:Rne/Rng family ribonuclease [Lederbergia citrea]MBS4222570.1 Rne/Rng family ribonuclease [Lederbergia citrea]